MKNLLVIALLFVQVPLAAAMPGAWNEFQRDLGIQAADHKDSPEHLALRQRETRSYEVGDTATFWKWDLSVMPPLWVQTPATCRAVGAHCYLFVADSEWGLHMDQTDVDAVMFRLEESTINDSTRGVIEMDIDLFGPIPDELDNDPRLVVFYSALGSFQGNYFDGYFSPYNQVTEAQAQQMNPPGHSNECEMIYMTCHPLDPIAPVRLSVLAHELQHLIHWGQDSNEETWLNEGCSELAMVVYGVPDPITGFPSNPDNNLTAWNQTFADYVKVMLFFTYLQEHYDATGLIQDLVSDPANGISSLTQQLAIHHPDTSFEELFTNWGTANIIDPEPPQDPLWGYTQLDLPPFHATFLDWQEEITNQTIQPYATDYLFLECYELGRMISIASDNPVSARQAIFSSNGFCQGVVDEGNGTFLQFDLPTSYDAEYVRVVVSNPYPVSVVYSVQSTVDNDEQLAQTPALENVSCHPNPFKGKTSISFALKEPAPLRLVIYNSRGQKVRTLADGFLPAGSHEVAWDGRDGSGRAVSSEVYLVRLSSQGYQLDKRLILLK